MIVDNSEEINAMSISSLSPASSEISQQMPYQAQNPDSRGDENKDKLNSSNVETAHRAKQESEYESGEELETGGNFKDKDYVFIDETAERASYDDIRDYESIEVTREKKSYDFSGQDICLDQVPIRIDNVCPIILYGVPTDYRRKVSKAICQKVVEINSKKPISKTIFSWVPFLLSPVIGSNASTLWSWGISISDTVKSVNFSAQKILKPVVETNVIDSLRDLEYKGFIPTTYVKAEEHYEKLKKEEDYYWRKQQIDNAIETLRFYEKAGFQLIPNMTAQKLQETDDE